MKKNEAETVFERLCYGFKQASKETLEIILGLVIIVLFVAAVALPIALCINGYFVLAAIYVAAVAFGIRVYHLAFPIKETPKAQIPEHHEYY